MVAYGRQRQRFVQVQDMTNENVRMLGFDRIGLEGDGRKVLQVQCHNDIGACRDSCCKHMAVVRVRQSQSWDE